MFRRQKEIPREWFPGVKLSGSQTGGQIQGYMSQKLLGKKRDLAKDGSTEERGSKLTSSRSNGCSELISYLKLTGKENKKNPCLGPETRETP